MMIGGIMRMVRMVWRKYLPPTLKREIEYASKVPSRSASRAAAVHTNTASPRLFQIENACSAACRLSDGSMLRNAKICAKLCNVGTRGSQCGGQATHSPEFLNAVDTIQKIGKRIIAVHASRIAWRTIRLTQSLRTENMIRSRREAAAPKLNLLNTQTCSHRK